MNELSSLGLAGPPNGSNLRVFPMVCSFVVLRRLTDCPPPRPRPALAMSMVGCWCLGVLFGWFFVFAVAVGFFGSVVLFGGQWFGDVLWV